MFLLLILQSSLFQNHYFILYMNIFNCLRIHKYSILQSSLDDLQKASKRFLHLKYRPRTIFLFFQSTFLMYHTNLLSILLFRVDFSFLLFNKDFLSYLLLLQHQEVHMHDFQIILFLFKLILYQQPLPNFFYPLKGLS